MCGSGLGVDWVELSHGIHECTQEAKGMWVRLGQVSAYSGMHKNGLEASPGGVVTGNPSTGPWHPLVCMKTGFAVGWIGVGCSTHWFS